MLSLIYKVWPGNDQIEKLYMFKKRTSTLKTCFAKTSLVNSDFQNIYGLNIFMPQYGFVLDHLDLCWSVACDVALRQLALAWDWNAQVIRISV